MPACTSLVHTKETNAPSCSLLTYGDHLRHLSSGEHLAAETVYRALDRDGSQSYVWKLNTCRDTAWFSRHTDSGEVRIASKTCHLRWCPLCASSKRTYISLEVQKWVDTLKYPKFLTLTLRHQEISLAEQIDRLYKYFRTLRRRKYFDDLVSGGIWFFQIRKSRKDHLWHPHIHCLIGGKYIPHGWLKGAWEEITFGSTVIDIRPIRDSSKACNDAARYAACPGSLVGLSLEDGVDLVSTMHGRRICGSWGTARSVKLRPPKLSDSGTWESVGSWESVMTSKDYDQNAQAIFAAYKNNNPLPYGIDMAGSDPELQRPDQLLWSDYDLDAMYPVKGKPP